MKKIIPFSLQALAAILLSVTMVNAQTIRLSQKYTTEAVDNPAFTSYLINDYYYVIQDKYNSKSPIYRDVQVDMFDNKGEFVSSSGLIDATMNYTEPNNWVGMLPLTSGLAMFKSRYQKEGDSKRSDLYAYPFNLTQRGSGIKIATTSSEGAMNAGNFYVASSPDGSKVAVLVQHPYMKEKRENCDIIVFDNSFKEVWRKNFDFPFDNGKHPNNTLWVNNAGAVFILKEVDPKNENPYQSFVVFTSNGATMKESRLAMGVDGKISSYQTAFTPQGDLVMGGLYFNDKKFGVNVEKPKGVFRLSLSGSDGSLQVGFTPQNFTMTTKAINLILLEGGGVILTSEEQTVKSTPLPDKPFEYNYEYTNANIYVNKISEKGELQWQHIAKREVKSVNDGAKSNGVFTSIQNGNISLIYRDYYYKYDGKQHAVVGFAELNRFINVHRSLSMDGKVVSDTYIKRLGNDDSKEAIIIYLVPATGKQLDEKNCLFMGCTEKILYGIKVTF